MTLCYNRGQASFSFMIAVTEALIEQVNNESLKVLKFGKGWDQSLFKRIGFKTYAATTGKVIIPEDAQKDQYNIVTKIETYNIPRQLVFSMDQNPLNYIQSSRYTMENL